MNDTQRENRLKKAQLRVLFTVPFYAVGVSKLPTEWADDIPTACTDGKRLKISRAWFDTLEDQEIVTVLAHEVSHCLLGHMWRAPSGADPELWNEACDHAVNLQLEEFSKLVTAKNLADPFPFPEGNWCKNPAFSNMPEEQIYQLLAARKPPGGQSGQPGQSGSGGGQQSTNGKGQGQGQGKGQGQQPGQQPGHTPFGEFQVINPAKDKQTKTDWQHTFIQSCTLAKGRGNLPGSMARVLGEFLDPKVPWFELVRQWLREQASDDWNWQKPNVYYSDCEFILPKLESERIGAVVFAKDTSGSIDEQTGAQFIGEQQSFLDDLRPSKIVDICCDAAIHRVTEYRPGDTIAKDFPGGGGTDFRPVFDHIAKEAEVPKCLVFFTDLQGTFPDETPEYPVLWVVYGDWGSHEAPFGTVIKAS